VSKTPIYQRLGECVFQENVAAQEIPAGQGPVGDDRKKLHEKDDYPTTSRKHQAHKIWPYLLCDRKIDRSNQVFALDTTYIPIATASSISLR
jgi:hypothetical protein